MVSGVAYAVDRAVGNRPLDGLAVRRPSFSRRAEPDMRPLREREVVRHLHALEEHVRVVVVLGRRGLRVGQRRATFVRIPLHDRGKDRPVRRSFSAVVGRAARRAGCQREKAHKDGKITPLT